MYYIPLKRKKTFVHTAKSISKAVDKILTKSRRLEGLDLKQLFYHVNFLKICAFKMYDDKDLLLDVSTNEMGDGKELIFGQTASELLNSRNQDLIWVFVHNLQDLMDLTEELDDFSELNQYIYEILNSDKN